MSSQIGLWVDHRKAVLVIFSEYGEAMVEIESHLEKHVNEGGVPHTRTPFGPQDGFADDTVERQVAVHLSRYYDEVVDNLSDADAIFIFGPGEAKNELKKRFESKPRKGVIVLVQPADRMTPRQIAAKARLFFHKRKFQGRSPRVTLKSGAMGEPKPPRR